MDFSQLLLEYKSYTTNKKKGTFWWKEQKWNTEAKVKQGSLIERSFSRTDYILSISGKWESCFQWLLSNQVLGNAPDCQVCKNQMEMSPPGAGFKRDMRMYRCTTCLTREPIRCQSFMLDISASLQEFLRICFYYFCKGYEPELAHREMTENSRDGVGACVGKGQVYNLYVQARERISRYAIYNIRVKKFGGLNQEVLVDVLKIHLRGNKGRNEEYVVLGFIEKASGRQRGYIVPNSKMQTVVQYLAKNVARGSILYTPFYNETGWEFLDKYYQHQRLLTPKGQKYDYHQEHTAFLRKSGFDKMWRSIRQLELTYLKFKANMRRYGKVHENLQMFVDEQVWRSEHSTLPQRREALCMAFNQELWKDEQEQIRLGIGGGYGQFGILNEAEFNTIIKADSKRIKKFHEHPDQFKQQFNCLKYPKKDDGVRLVTGIKKGMNKDGTMAINANDPDDDDIEPRLKNGFGKNSQDDEIDIIELARQRFDFDPVLEARKMQEQTRKHNINEEDLFGDFQAPVKSSQVSRRGRPLSQESVAEKFGGLPQKRFKDDRPMTPEYGDRSIMEQLERKYSL